MASVYDYSGKTISGEDKPIADFRGQVLLIVNTASKCGFTPQFKGLESLYETYKGKGLMVLGFPCNQFLKQDPGSDAQISEFCELNYGVTFPMFAKIDVNGENAHPLFRHLTTAAPGLLGSKAVKWNFTKFLVDRAGRPVSRHAPTTPPAALARHIEALL